MWWTVLSAGLAMSLMPSFAADAKEKATGKVVALDGKVKVNGKPAAVGATVQAGDEIATGKTGTVIIRVPNAALRLSQKTRIKFLDVFSATTRLEVRLGGLLSAVVPGTRYEVRTPVAVAAVRGTTFFVDVPSDTETYGCVCSGTVAFQDTYPGTSKRIVTSSHHAAIRILRQHQTNTVEPATMLKHTDAEVAEVESYLK